MDTSTKKLRARVLLVDDCASSLETMAALLDDRFEVVCAPCAEQAVRIAMQGPFEVLCTDLVMPGMNGVDLVRVLTAMGCRFGVVLVSAYEMLRSRSFAGLRAPAGVVHRILKPVDPERLIAAVEASATMASMHLAVTNARVATRPRAR